VRNEVQNLSGQQMAAVVTEFQGDGASANGHERRGDCYAREEEQTRARVALEHHLPDASQGDLPEIQRVSRPLWLVRGIRGRHGDGRGAVTRLGEQSAREPAIEEYST
jgi:hypothetical protein